jgi:YVTN family beta-propeller protein
MPRTIQIRNTQLRMWQRWAIAVALALTVAFAAAPMATAGIFTTPMNSSPISLSADLRLVWVVNPRDDTVSVLRTDTNTVIATIATGDEPRGVALDDDNTFAFVANAASNNVTVIRIVNDSFGNFQAVIDRTLKTGAEPWNIVISPDSKRVFVANSGQDTITVIDAATRTIIGQINLGNSLCNDPDRQRRFQPRGMAVILANTQLYVTRFLSFTKTAAGGRQGIDTGREGVVCRIAIDTDSPVIGGYVPAQLIKFAPRPTGFAVDSTGDGIPDPTTAFPNQMQSLVIRENKGFMPNIAASPTSPLAFNNDTQAFVTVLNNVGSGVLADGGALNLHLGARIPEAGKKKLFFANPWAIAFTNQAGAGSAYVVSAGSDLLVKLDVNTNNVLSFTGGASTTRYIDLNDPANPATSGAKAGKNPQGIVILANGPAIRAYVANQVSGNVSIVDTVTDTVVKVVQTALVPPSGSLAETLSVGAEMFFSSRGHFNRPAGTAVSTDERLSSDGWQSCASCHFNGWTDGVIWQFPAGPRKSVNLAGTFNPRNRNQQKILNYSAIFDEVEDFEANIRNVSGPGNIAPPALPCQTAPPPSTSLLDPNHGLLFGDNNDINVAPCVVNSFAKANANRRELSVNPVGATASVEALTALREWVRFAVRVPNGPLNSSEITGGVPLANINAGRTLFGQQQCASCHGGGLWSISDKDFTSPPLGSEISCEAFVTGDPFCTIVPTGDPAPVQYLRRFLKNAGSFNLGVPGGGNPIGNNIGAAEKAAAGRDPLSVPPFKSLPPKDALGRDYNADGFGNGYSPQSLLGVHLVQPFMHNGACETLRCVVGDVDHRTGNGSIPDVLNTTQKINDVATFLESINAATVPFP